MTHPPIQCRPSGRRFPALLFCVAATAPATARRTAVSTGSGPKAHAGEPASLQLFAATFNGGNMDYRTFADTRSMWESITRGHEAEGQIADVVLVGLQEFKDDDEGIAKYLGNNFLWTELTKQRTAQLLSEVSLATTPTEEVMQSRQKLSQSLAVFGDGLKAQLQQFADKFGLRNSEFYDMLGTKSTVRNLVENLPGIEQKTEGLLTVRESYMAHANSSMKDRFSKMSEEGQLLRKAAAHDKVQAILETNFSPLKAWAQEVAAKVQALLEPYPNLVHTKDGAAALAQLFQDIANVKKVETSTEMAARQALSEFVSRVSVFDESLRTAVSSLEKRLVTKPLDSLNQVLRDLDALSQDLSKLSPDKIGEAVRTVARSASAPNEEAMSAALEKYVGVISDTMLALNTEHHLGVKPEHVDVPRLSQRLPSTMFCRQGGHYDTILHVFVNPWSDWKITQVPWSSDTCKPSGGSSGCSIDNSKGECAKGVNIIVLDATNKKVNKRMRICALNTHMSFGRKTSVRMEGVHKAMLEAEAAGCTSSVFVGDFNSRMHCDSEEDAIALPAYERSSTPEGSSFEYILNVALAKKNVSDSGPRWSLRDSDAADLDELSQFMSRKWVKCYDKKTDGLVVKTISWRFNGARNLLDGMNVREVGGLPNFAPTYSMRPRNKVPSGSWHRCPQHMQMCYWNKDEDGKHNPAWTDRIIVRDSPSKDGVQIEASFYESRPVLPEIGSDHVPVVAGMQLRI